MAIDSTFDTGTRRVREASEAGGLSAFRPRTGSLPAGV